MLNKEGLIDSGSYFRFSMLVIVIGFLMTAYRINDMYWRNNLNYDNYDWLYDTPVKDEGTWEYKKRKEANEGILLGESSSTCRGSNCCYDGTYWNGTSCFPNQVMVQPRRNIIIVQLVQNIPYYLHHPVINLEL